MHPGILWIALAQHLLLAAGQDDLPEVEWVSVLNAVKVEAHTGMTDKQFCARLMGADERDYHLKPLIYAHILRPLCWLGLLQETRHNRSERFFTKTALWPIALIFEDSPPLPPVTSTDPGDAPGLRTGAMFSY